MNMNASSAGQHGMQDERQHETQHETRHEKQHAGLRTIGFPGRYVQGPGALDALGTLLRELSVARAFLLIDPFVRNTLAPRIRAACETAGVVLADADFPGECTAATIASLSDTARAAQAGAIIAVGGGKAIDTAKGIALALGAAIVVCPTIASSDAPTSRHIVIYDERHHVAGVDFLPRNPDAVVVDTDVIIAAPRRFFAAGIGDAISKKFEAEQCARAGGLNSYGTPAGLTAGLLADQTYRILIADGAQAYRDVGQRRHSATVERVVEATVLLSGVGFESGGLSLAHSLVRGFNTIPAMSNALHGELVAFGTLVQMFAEGRTAEEIDAVARLLLDTDLPVRLADLGQATPLGDAEWANVVSVTLSTKYARHMVPTLTEARLLEALTRADAYGQTLSRPSRPSGPAA